MTQFNVRTLFFLTAVYAVIAATSRSIGMRALAWSAGAVVVGVLVGLCVSAWYRQGFAVILSAIMGALYGYAGFVVHHYLAASYRWIPFGPFVLGSNAWSWGLITQIAALAGAAPAASIAVTRGWDSVSIVRNSARCTAVASLLPWAYVAPVTIATWSWFRIQYVIFGPYIYLFIVCTVLVGAAWGAMVALVYIWIPIPFRRTPNPSSPDDPQRAAR